MILLFTDDAPVATANVEKVFIYYIYYIVHLLYHRQKGMIINVCASIASAPPTPLMTVYQAAMVSINKDTTRLGCFIALHVELRQQFHSRTTL